MTKDEKIDRIFAMIDCLLWSGAINDKLASAFRTYLRDVLKEEEQ